MIDNVTIGFSTTNKFMSRVIRWATRGKVSHAWVSFHDKCLDTYFVMQAETWGYELRTWDRWKKENILMAEFEPSVDISQSVTWMARTSLGKKYDWTSAFFSGIRRWIGKWIKGRFKSPKRLMCSESVIRILLHSEVSGFSGLDPETTSPSSLLSKCLDNDEEMSLSYASPEIAKMKRG